jgi:hypothetical protein
MCEDLDLRKLSDAVITWRASVNSVPSGCDSQLHNKDSTPLSYSPSNSGNYCIKHCPYLHRFAPRSSGSLETQTYVSSHISGIIRLPGAEVAQSV